MEFRVAKHAIASSMRCLSVPEGQIVCVLIPRGWLLNVLLPELLPQRRELRLCEA